MVEEPSDIWGRWFAIYAETGEELFSARLLHHAPTLQISWTESVPWTPHRIRAVEEYTGIQINTITGRASDLLEQQIRDGTFDEDSLLRRLERVLGDEWEIVLTPVPKAVNVWDLRMSRKG